MKTGFARVCGAVVLSLVIGACSPHNLPPGNPQPDVQPVQGATFAVHVSNTMAMPMNISYRYGGDDIVALGTVPANGNAVFTVPNRGGDNLEITATDQNGGNFRHEKVDMKAGSIVNVTLK